MSIQMPKGGIKELLKSSAGKAYLEKLKERHKIDLLQPSNPMFQKVYGKKSEQIEQMHAKQKDVANAEWEKKMYKHKKYF